MRILLIVPRLSLDTAPLGVGYMAAFLKQYGYAANIVCTGNMDDQTFTKIIKKQNPDLIGFTAMTLWIKEVYRMASLVKKLMPNCKIVCGGVHPTALPILTLNECGLLDAVVIGEAEETFLQLVQAIERDKDLSQIKGLAFRKGSKIKKNPERRRLARLDVLPFPKRELLGSCVKLVNEMDVFPARGCPFSCIECSYSAVSGRRLRVRSPRNVAEEIETLVDNFSPEVITFSNCTFTLQKRWLVDFCREIRERGLNEKCGLDVTTRPDTLNGEVIKMLAKSGCSKISLWTVNSGDDRILSNTRRKYTTKHIEDAVNQCRKQGVESFVGFTFGNPGETEETAWNTIQFAKKLKANGYWFGINRPFPGSELYQIGLREGYDIQGRWDEYEMRPPHPTKLPTPRTRLSPTTLFELINTATKEVKK